MYKLMIVEDEAVVRQGIIKKIPFADLGFTLTAACENGALALEAVKKDPPDVVITDISMPVMDGLELAKELQNGYPFIKTVLLTGYNEFEFARKAVALKVYEYVLKPVSSKMLTGLLTKLAGELDAEKKSLKNVIEMQRNLYLSQAIVTEHYLNQLITGPQTEEEIKSRLSHLSIDLFGPGPYTAMVVVIDELLEVKEKYQMTDELLSYGVCNICREIVGGRGVVFRNDLFKTVAVIKDKRMVSLVADSIVQIIPDNLNFTVSVFVGKSFPGLCGVHPSYQSAQYALGHRHLFGPGKVNYAEFIEKSQNYALFYEKDHEAKICEAILSGDEAACAAAAREMVSDMHAFYLSFEQVNFYLHSLLAAIYKRMEQLSGSEIFSFLDAPRFNDFDSFDGIACFLNEMCKDIIRRLTEQKGGYNKMQIERAIDYMNAHLDDASLTLPVICAYLALSTSYFSSLFKAETGKTFVEYLTGIRMEKAKQLLGTTDLKTYEIAERCGFSDPHYFSSSFKKYTSQTPKEYRESHV